MAASHLKGPEIDGTRKPYFHSSRVSYVDGLEENLGNTNLNAATDNELGGVIIGDNITNANGRISITRNNITNALGYTPPERLAPVSFTIEIGAWNVDTSETSEFVHYADIAASNLTADDYVEISFDRASQSTISRANLCPSGETMNGRIRLYSENIPDKAINGEYVITKGAV